MTPRPDPAPDLVQGELILWQGRPEGRAPLDVVRPAEILFGFAFLLFSMFWMQKAMESGNILWMAGLIFFGLGLRFAVIRPYLPRLRARFARYTLTNRRAVVALHWPVIGMRQQALIVTPATIVDTDSQDPATITLRQILTGREGARPATLQFERISEARHVLDLIRTVQKGAA